MKDLKHSYSKLANDIEADVLIIGGGLTGISTAYYLKNNTRKKFNWFWCDF